MRFLILLFFFMGCYSNSSNSSTSSTSFDSSVEPTASGTWYEPSVSATWQWQLSGTLNTGYEVDIYDVDLFNTSSIAISSLQSSGKKVICYFSAGSWEDWRSDASDFPSGVLGSTMDGWEDEKWLDISNESLISIMEARLDLAVEKGCDGVEPDNMDGYQNSTGFTLSGNDQLAYNKFIANAAHERELSVGLKNDLDQIDELLEYFDFSLNEECYYYNECEKLTPFIDANKPVFNAEYADKYKNNTSSARDNMCNDTLALDFRTLVLPLDLDDSFRYSCD